MDRDKKIDLAFVIVLGLVAFGGLAFLSGRTVTDDCNGTQGQLMIEWCEQNPPTEIRAARECAWWKAVCQ